MPCVCLSNTRARWYSLKAAKSAHVNTGASNAHEAQSHLAPLRPDRTVAERGIFSDSKTLRIPHPRPSISASHTKAPSSGPTHDLHYGSHHPSVRLTRADLINAESKLGSTIFGPIPAGHRREFFHDRDNIWIWHEDWYDGRRNPHQLTVRYEVRATGVYKKISTGSYFKLEGEELENFRRATHAYLYVIKKNLYNQSRKPLPRA